VRSIARQAEPLLPHTAREALGPLTRLAVFADGEGFPSQAEMWLSRELIERFIAVGCPGTTEATRANYRGWLLRVREAVIGPELATGRPAKLSASAASRPYTRSEQAALWSWATSQSTHELRHGCTTLLALGLGAGLDSAEIVPLHSHDVRTAGNGAIVVNVRGRRARPVVCRRPFEQVLAECATSSARSGEATYLFRPGAHARAKNTVTNFLARTADAPPSTPTLKLSRARATWLVGLIDDQLPLPVIVAAAGVDTLHALSRFLPFVRPVTAPQAAELLRGQP
jgi:hypothetical protein